MVKDTWAKIEDRMTALRELNDRQDATANLLHWDDNPYQLVKPDGKTELRDSISVTPNLPKVFAHGVVSDLLGGKWQTVVEGVSGRKSHLIESFVDDNLAQADEILLIKYGIPSLFGWLCNHVCARWAIGARWISQIIDGEYKIDCLPVDMRWTPFVLNKWVAPIAFRSKDDLEQELEEYAKLAEQGIGEYFKYSISGTTDIETRDYWDGEKNELWVAKQLVYSQKNPLGYPPFVIAIPASGFMLRDKGYLKHEGEDILFLNTGLYTELARSMSLEQTSGYAGLYPAYEQERKTFDSRPSEPVPKLDETLAVREGERHQPVPRGDINRAGQTAREDIQGMISSGAPLSPRDYNTPPSAILLAGETELISRLQNARKDALGIFRSQLARLMIDQFIEVDKGGADILIGQRGRKTKYSASRLGDPDDYTITYHLSVKSKRQELANLAEFTGAYGRLPLKWNLTNVLMVDDPDEVIKELEMEQADADPALKLYKMARSYAIEADDLDDESEADAMKIMSRLLTERGVALIRERQQPMPQGAEVPQVEQPKGSTQLMSQLGGAAGALRGEAGQPKPTEVTQ